jgi:hypothetical protein
MNIIRDEDHEDERVDINLRRPERAAGPRIIRVERPERPPERIRVEVPPAYPLPRVPSYRVFPGEDERHEEYNRREEYERRGYWTRRRTRHDNNDGIDFIIYRTRRRGSDESRPHLESHSDDDGGYYTNIRRPGREAIPTATNARETTARLYEGSMRDDAWRRKRKQQLGILPATIILPEWEPPPGAR